MVVSYTRVYKLREGFLVEIFSIVTVTNPRNCTSLSRGIFALTPELKSFKRFFIIFIPNKSNHNIRKNQMPMRWEWWEVNIGCVIKYIQYNNR